MALAAGGVPDRLWEVEDMVAFLEESSHARSRSPEIPTGLPASSAKPRRSP